MSPSRLMAASFHIRTASMQPGSQILSLTPVIWHHEGRAASGSKVQTCKYLSLTLKPTAFGGLQSPMTLKDVPSLLFDLQPNKRSGALSCHGVLDDIKFIG